MMAQLWLEKEAVQTVPLVTDAGYSLTCSMVTEVYKGSDNFTVVYATVEKF